MNETVVVGRTASRSWQTAAWVVGAAVCATALAQAVFIIGIGVAEVSAAIFGLTERVGIPVFAAIFALTIFAYGALIHLIVRAMGRSTVVPWGIWPAMAALPAAWIFVALADGSGILQPILAVMQLVGIAIAFVTLGERRWTRG